MLHTVVVLAVGLDLVCVRMQPVGWDESVTTPGHGGRHVEASVLACVSAHWVCDPCARYAAGVFLMPCDHNAKQLRLQ